MAEVKSMDVEVRPDSDLSKLEVVVEPTIYFNEFDRNTNINYRLTYELYAIDGSSVPVKLMTLEPVQTPVVQASDVDPNEIGVSPYEAFPVDRTALDEDGPEESDELQVWVTLKPTLPQEQTFPSGTVNVDL